MVEFNVCQKQSFTEIVIKYMLPTVEKINSGVREAIDSSTIAAKEQELRDRCIMMFNRAERKTGNEKYRIEDDFDFITDFVNPLVPTTSFSYMKIISLHASTI